MTKSKAKSNKAKSNKARSNKGRSNKAGSNKAGSNKARSNKARSNKAKNTKCKEGTKPINVKGKLFCVGKCPHSGGPILYDPNEDDLFCPWHNSRFTTKGKYKSGPAAGQNLKIS